MEQGQRGSAGLQVQNSVMRARAPVYAAHSNSNKPQRPPAAAVGLTPHVLGLGSVKTLEAALVQPAAAM